MAELSAEKFAQRLHDYHLMENRELDDAFAALGGSNTSLENFQQLLVQRELLTNWQMQRVTEGHRRGYFYGNWKVLYIVGHGTFARVYRAVHRTDGGVTAVKVLRNRYSNDLDTRDRFLREAKTVMQLRHPNIVPIHDASTEHGRTYMVMDFVEGQNLRDFVKLHGSLEMPISMKILRDITAGLDYAYTQGVTHRDLKLSNVLLSSAGRASLVDFGLAVVDQSIDDAAGFNPRSVDYAGLEKVTNVGRDDKRSDMFFLGCILYHMLSGKSALFETRERMKRMHASRFREIEPITRVAPNVAHSIVILIKRLMEIDPAKRIQTPSQALNEIDSVIEGIKAGDLRQYDEELSQKDAEKYERLRRKITEGNEFTVMLVESNQSVQDAMRIRLKRLGYRVLIINNPQRALERFEHLDPAEELPAHCVMFGCSELRQEALEAFNYFGSHPRSKDLPALLLVSKNQLDFLEKAELAPHRVAIQMPLKFREVRFRLRELLGIESTDETAENTAS
ncbi:protein kinase [Vicingaceae bacterium]|nr:protein kinase [Vicingaceae bacterium]